MKYNKRICILAIVATVISLVLYFSFRTCCDIVKDLSLSLFSASCLLIFTAYIGYNVEKSALKRKILLELPEHFYVTLSTETDDNHANIPAIKRALKKSLLQLNVLHGLLAELYQGSFIKDCTLKNIINNSINKHTARLALLDVYLSNSSPKAVTIRKQIEILANEHDSLIDSLFDWMNRKRFTMGEEFELNENIIIEDEDSNA